MKEQVVQLAAPETSPLVIVALNALPPLFIINIVVMGNIFGQLRQRTQSGACGETAWKSLVRLCFSELEISYRDLTGVDEGVETVDNYLRAPESQHRGATLASGEVVVILRRGFSERRR